MPTFIDISGKRFGRLLVLHRVSKFGEERMLWKCRCECGNEIVTMGQSIKNGSTRSCGCARKGRISPNRSHGMRDTVTYNCWASMKNRCLNPNDESYHRYGGRGIKICERWMMFENFFEDMGERPKGMTIERINNNQGYSKDNCKWATVQEQCRNRRSNRWIEAFGKRMLLSDLAIQQKIPMKNLWYRLNAGWDVEEALRRGKCKNQYV